MARAARVPELGLEAITIEGGLIAPEQVARIAATERNDRTAADYDSPKGVRLGDEIARYFRIGQAIWRDYNRVEQPTITQTAQFARDLLTQAFGFTDLAGPAEHRDGSRRYRIAWEAKSGRVPVVVAAPVPDGEGFTKALPEFGDGEGGRARRSPIVLLQDWLNHTDAALWGLVFAGDRVRLMRDNASLTRAAWIEADLGTIFRDDMFADFTAWWLLTHASRFGAAGTPASAAPLERWREEGLKQGTAARERLREGVEKALRELGQGSVDANPAIRDRVAGDPTAMTALFEELLRTVYRLIFLAVAEDRDLLHPRATGQKVRDLYAANYSFGFWRDRAARRAAYDAHHDAWEGMKITIAALEHGQPALGLPALGGLFARAATPILNTARVPNRRFLTAVHSLGFITVNSALTRINWRAMRTEELGSVYESLLEIRPRLLPDGTFDLDSGARGNARKTSGSYYTPDSLVETLLDSALDPVLAQAEANGGVDAILDLKVIDPACGSGHFLLGAARRMADKVAQLRNPDAPDTQAALRDVVSRSIHGVDRNPMAVELAKVALWIESVSPGQPLGFLDANIRCGDALLGVISLEALEEGVPDEAYKPLTGDDKAAAKYYAQQNKAAKKGQGQFDWSGGTGAMPPRRLASNLSTIRRMPEDTVGQVEKKRQAFEAWRNDPARYATRVACDLYTAAFLLPKTAVPLNGGRHTVPTTAEVRTRLSGGQVYGPLEAAAVDAAATARALHWPLAFSDVIVERGGFDVVLGNPPWERIKLQEQEYFAGTPVADAPNAAARTRAIEALGRAEPGTADRVLYDHFQIAKRVAEAMSLFARVPGDAGGRFRYTGTGDVNTYALFAEHFLNLTREGGRAGIIVPTGIATDATTAPFFGYLVSSARLVRLFDFENSAPLFPGVHRSFKFSLLTIGSGVREAEFAFFLTDPAQLEDARRRFTLSPAEIARINPNTKTAPVFRARADAELTASIYNRVPVLIDEVKGAAGNPWRFDYMTKMFDMADSSALFRNARELATDGWERSGTDWVRPQAERPVAPALALSGGRDAAHLDLSTGSAETPDRRYVPLYEAKMIHHFDHRWATFPSDGGSDASRDVSLAEKQDAAFEPTPRYWMEQWRAKERQATKGWRRGWLIGWRDICRATDERTAIVGIYPAFAIAHTIRNLFVDHSVETSSALYANICSLALDVVARQQVGGTHLTVEMVKQLPILPPAAYTEADLTFIVPRVLELTYTSYAMASFARDLGYDGPPFAWDEDRRAQLRAELDAWYALAYGLSRDELRYVLDPKDVMGADYPSETFRVLQNNEVKRFGEYRTRRLVLAAYDVLAAAPPATAELADGTWERRIADELDVRLLMTALVRRMRGRTPVADVLRAFVLAARPELLAGLLPDAQRAEWRRLVGSDANAPSNVVGIGAAYLSRFREARAKLPPDALCFDAAAGTWDRGASIYSLSLPPWAVGRADFVWYALRLIDTGIAAAAMTEEERDFVTRLAA
ncbi:N-6 DNA methylase [Sphingomonas sp. BK235]|uniref:Eco57I restriction-modification methylase domain-containing protein n=1 Tax=Sphingomonas sp. BK235 TaxID=2512131 RepID=UPI001048E749|nr:N-6 DNA methylase [Sphingomonas sp. BK235]TCP37584.1 N-6 DNA methylase [Sphingomonas sp. BK235]